jgi:hypothetical protein
MNKIIYNIIGFNEEAVMIGCTLVDMDYIIADNIAYVETEANKLLDESTIKCKGGLTFDKIEKIVIFAKSKQIRIEFI